MDTIEHRNEAPTDENDDTFSGILAGLAPIDKFALAIRKSVRTTYRYTQQANGLPFLKLGRTVYIPIESGRAWILAQEVQKNPVRPLSRRGRVA